MATSKPDHGILSTAKRGEFGRHKGLPIALTVYVNVAPQFELQYWDRIIKGRSNPETVDKESRGAAPEASSRHKVRKLLFF